MRLGEASKGDGVCLVLDRGCLKKSGFPIRNSLVRLFFVPILKPYADNSPPFVLEADLRFQGRELLLEYKLSDPQGLFELPQQNLSWTGAAVPRQDGLWNATCFEAFLQPVGFENYYEFNFALSPAWQAYRFDSYRKPQPPARVEDFILKSLQWEASQGRLQICLENKTSHRQFQVGLTAILVEKTGAKHYCALAHKGTKPDFHLSESFTLLRGATL